MKSWICGEELLFQAKKSLDERIHLGDHVKFHGHKDSDDEECFNVMSYSVLVKFSETNPDSTFLAIPPGDVAEQDPDSISKSHCKFWLNTGSCPRDPCQYLHEKSNSDLKAARKAFVDHKFKDSHDLSSRHQRASIFADWLINTFADVLQDGSDHATVLDVAGGRGDLSFELKVKRCSPANVMIVDPRDQKLKRWQQEMVKKASESTPQLPTHIKELFDKDIFHHQALNGRKVHLIVGMHPDEATEPLVDIAVANKIAFAVIPCCLFSHLFPQRRLLESGDEPRTYEDYIKYLCEKHEGIQSVNLPFRGRNTVLYCKF